MPVATIKPTQLKKQLRDTERLLTRPNLPADMRREQERKLAHISAMLVERITSERMEVMKKKYAKVRFFENCKAERHLKTASRELIGENSEEKLAKWVEAKKDLVYVQSFPFDQKYISLWPSVPLNNANLLAERSEMRMKLAAQHGCDNVAMESALAMAQSILDGVTLSKNKAVTQVESAIQSFKGGNNDEDEEEDDGEESFDDHGSSDEELEGSDEDSNVEDEEALTDSNEDSDEDGDEDEDDSNESSDESDSDSDDDEESDDEEDDESDSDIEDEDEEDEESDEEEDDEEEDESSEDGEPSRKRRK